VSAFIEEHRARFGVEPICRVLDVSASAFYHRASGRRSARVVEDERLLERIRKVHGELGLRLPAHLERAAPARRARRARPRSTADAPARDPGRQAARQAVAHHHARPEALRAPDLVERDFTATGPDALWVADFTYLRCWEGLVFFAFVIDVYSRRIVGWQFAPHMRTDLVLDALRMALSRRSAGADVQLIHHSDAGSQYTSYAFNQVLDDHGVLASIGSVGDAFDNAMAESFVDSFKTELIADRVWRTRTQLELAIVEYVAWFNNDRLHSALGDIPPAEFEALYAAQNRALVLTTKSITETN